MEVTPSLNSIVYSIWNTVRARVNINDSITWELVKFHVLNLRAQLLKQDSNKGYTADPYVIQDLGCVELVRADAAECCQVDVGCNVLRTKLQIPSTIELHHKQLFTRIGPIKKDEEPFDYISYEKVPFLKHSKYTKKRVIAYQTSTSGYMYFVVPDFKLKTMKYVNIQGVFEDPTQVSEFTTCPAVESACKDCDELLPCYNDDMPFPIKSWMIPTLIEMTIKLFVKQQSLTPTDSNSDGKLDVTNQTEQ